MLPLLEQRLLDITKYHSHEWAQRLDEIGGPGVGGTELANRPNFIHQANSDVEMVLLALETSVVQTWEEATWCYVYGEFRGSILLSAAVLELVLRLEHLGRRYPVHRTTLGPLIRAARQKGIITEDMELKAQAINSRRNDVIHANIQTDRPTSLLQHSGSEHEVESLQDASRNVTEEGWLTGDGETIEISFGRQHPTYSRIHLFKSAARASILDLRQLLVFFYPTP